METFNVKWNGHDDEYYVNIPIDNQTLHMSFWLDDWTDRSVHLGVYLQVYTKRKRIVQEEGSFAITGKNPLATVIYARKAFEALERESLKGYNEDYDIIIFIHWTNNLRRNIYERFLLPRGYRYGILNNQKVLMKKWKKGEGIGAIREIEENSSDDDGRAT